MLASRVADEELTVAPGRVLKGVAVHPPLRGDGQVAELDIQCARIGDPPPGSRRGDREVLNNRVIQEVCLDTAATGLIREYGDLDGHNLVNGIQQVHRIARYSRHDIVPLIGRDGVSAARRVVGRTGHKYLVANGELRPVARYADSRRRRSGCYHRVVGKIFRKIRVQVARHEDVAIPPAYHRGAL